MDTNWNHSFVLKRRRLTFCVFWLLSGAAGRLWRPLLFCHAQSSPTGWLASLHLHPLSNKHTEVRCWPLSILWRAGHWCDVMFHSAFGFSWRKISSVTKPAWNSEAVGMTCHFLSKTLFASEKCKSFGHRRVDDVCRGSVCAGVLLLGQTLKVDPKTFSGLQFSKLNQLLDALTTSELWVKVEQLYVSRCKRQRSKRCKQRSLMWAFDVQGEDGCAGNPHTDPFGLEYKKCWDSYLKLLPLWGASPALLLTWCRSKGSVRFLTASRTFLTLL